MGRTRRKLIPQFVAKWREGFDDVHGTRTVREGEGWLKKYTAHRFYRFDRQTVANPIPRTRGISACCRHAPWMRCGSCASGTASEGPVRLDWLRAGGDPVPARTAHGRNHQVQFLEAVELRARRPSPASRRAPLRLATYLGVVTALLAFAYALWIVIKALLWGDPVAGYDDHVGGAADRRGAADRAGTDWRIPWPALHRIQSCARCTSSTRGARPAEYPRRHPLTKPSRWKETAMRTVRHLLEAKAPEVFAIAPDAPVIDAIRQMAEKHIGAVLVMDGHTAGRQSCPSATTRARSCCRDVRPRTPRCATS